MVLKGEINLDKMITKNFRLDEINDAFQMLKEGKCIRCIIQMWGFVQFYLEFNHAFVSVNERYISIIS